MTDIAHTGQTLQKVFGETAETVACETKFVAALDHQAAAGAE